MAAAVGPDSAGGGARSSTGAEIKAADDVQSAYGQWKEGFSLENQSKGTFNVIVLVLDGCNSFVSQPQKKRRFPIRLYIFIGIISVLLFGRTDFDHYFFNLKADATHVVSFKFYQYFTSSFRLILIT